MFKISSNNNDGHANDMLDYGWNTTSQGYHDHLLRIERMPSVVTDLPRYPNIYMMHNNNNQATTQREGERRLITNQPHLRNQAQAAQGQKKVHFVEQGKTSGGSVDAEADGFIRQKHKTFELAKWQTFKAV